ncbi:MAG TPA: serine/threonine-protein kinase [Streptosporangiaceae bacterium]
MTTADHMPDRLGPYRLLDRIGEGGMGVVYLGRDPEQRSVAIKVLRPAVAGDPNARRRLAREVETMRRVRSPFVAEVLDTDVAGDTPYIVTRYVPGRTLDEVVGQDGPLTGARLARLASGLAEALAAIHAAGVVHRDLKPGNVMLVNSDPVVIDFGIAQALDSTRLTQTGMFMGTPGYLAPEVIEGQPAGSASDVHAWGGTVAFAATGRPPFGTGSYETIFYRIVNGQPDLAGVPAPLAELLAGALRRNPAARPAAAQLSALSAGLDVAALQPVPVPGGLGGGLLAPGTRADAPVRFPTQDAFAGGHAATVLPGQGVAGQGMAGQGMAGPAAFGGPAAGAAGLARPGTQPMAVGRLRADDFADVLPPVNYQPAGANGYPAATGDSFAGGRGPAAGRPAGPATADSDRGWAAPRRQPLLVLATMVIAVCVAVVLPVAGTLLALAMLTLLRAGDLAHRGADQRGAVLNVAAFPVFVTRSLIGTLLQAPLALVAGAAAAGLTYLTVPGSSLAHAMSYSAGAVIACYGYGPGSAKPRRQLNRVFSAMVRSPGVRAVALLVLGALAVAAVATAMTSPAAFWPLGAPTGTLVHLPAFPGLGQLPGVFGHLPRHFLHAHL